MGVYAVRVSAVAMILAESEQEALGIAHDRQEEISDEFVVKHVDSLCQVYSVEVANKLAGYDEQDWVYHSLGGDRRVSFAEALRLSQSTERALETRPAPSRECAECEAKQRALDEAVKVARVHANGNNWGMSRAAKHLLNILEPKASVRSEVYTVESGNSQYLDVECFARYERDTRSWKYRVSLDRETGMIHRSELEFSPDDATTYDELDRECAPADILEALDGRVDAAKDDILGPEQRDVLIRMRG
jgi:hypothetical protein